MDGQGVAETWRWSLLLAAVGILSFFFFYKHFICRKPRNLPPGPPGFPIIGNLLQLGTPLPQTLFALSQKYGPLVTLHLGATTTIVASSPETAKEILKTQGDTFAGKAVPEAAKVPYCAGFNIVFSQPGRYWRLLRNISNTHLFSSKKIDSLQRFRKQKVDQMTNDLFKKSMENKAVDVGKTAFNCAVNLMGNMVFSEDLFDNDSSQLQEFVDATDEVMVMLGAPNLADFFPVLQSVDAQGIKKKTQKAFSKFIGVLRGLVQNRLQEGARQNHGDLLATLLELRSDDFDTPQILGLLADLFLGATETTSTTVEWAMSELMKNPQLLKNAQDELERVVGRARKVEEKDCERLPYLRAIVKETFRLHPAVPLLTPHMAMEQAEVCGYTIPKGARVMVNAWGIGRDPTVWKNAEIFDPERFVGSQIDFRGRHFELITFGSGRRMCAGLPLADKMVHHMLATFVHSFDWSLPLPSQELDLSERLGITLRKSAPLLILPTPHLPHSVY